VRNSWLPSPSCSMAARKGSTKLHEDDWQGSRGLSMDSHAPSRSSYCSRRDWNPTLSSPPLRAVKAEDAWVVPRLGWRRPNRGKIGEREIHPARIAEGPTVDLAWVASGSHLVGVPPPSSNGKCPGRKACHGAARSGVASLLWSRQNVRARRPPTFPNKHFRGDHALDRVVTTLRAQTPLLYARTPPTYVHPHPEGRPRSPHRPRLVSFVFSRSPLA